MHMTIQNIVSVQIEHLIFDLFTLNSPASALRLPVLLISAIHFFNNNESEAIQHKFHQNIASNSEINDPRRMAEVLMLTCCSDMEGLVWTLFNLKATCSHTQKAFASNIIDCAKLDPKK